MRSIGTVIDQLGEIAGSDAEFIAFNNHLKRIKTNCVYTAPEAMGTRWQELYVAIADECGPHPMEERRQKLAACFADMPLDKFIKTYCKRSDQHGRDHQR